MPTYEYRCPDGHEFELFQRISDEPGAACPECGKEAQRVISGGAGFLFKGEGFYITDYRSEDYRKKAAREAPSEGGGGAGSGSSKEAAGGGSSGSKKESGSGSEGSSPSSPASSSD